MATITHIKTPDGVIHDIGGGGGSSTYTLTKSGSTITLTGSGGDVSSVVDSNTTYTISISGHTITLTPSSGSAQTVTVPDNNTTYTISVSGSTITLTPSSGSAQTITIPDATTSASGVMSASDKSKLNGIASGAEVNVQSDWNQTDSTADDYIKNKPTIPPGVTVDSALSTTSTNPVENRVITNALDNKVDKETGKGLSTNDFTTAEKNKLAGIQAGAEQNVQSDWNEADSTSDAYILNKPSIPTKTSDLTNDSDFVSDASYVHTDNNFTTTLKNKLDGIQSGAEVNVQADWTQSDSTADDFIKNKPTLATVATSGDYDDLTNKPTIPTVNDGTLTIQKNGTTIDSFTANQSGNTTVNVTVPTATSDLTNDSNFVSDASYVHTDNNFTTALKNKLNGIEAGAEVNVQADWNEADSTADDYIKNKPTLSTVATTGDYDDLSNKPTIPTVSVTQKTSVGTNIADITINGTTTQLYAPSGGGGAIEYTLSGSGDDDEYTITATPTTGTATSATIPAATQTDAGVMTAADKTKLDGIATGAEVNVQADWDEANSSSDAYILNKPTIPTVNDATLTIQKNGTTIDTFTANSNTNTTVNVTVPTATSELNNDSDFVSDASYVHTDNNFTTTLKDKLDGIEAGAQVNPTYTAVTGKPTGNLTPDFGGTATISQIEQDTTGQIRATDRTITIPNTAATTSTAGLMSATDKTKLNHLGTLTSDDGTKSLSNTTTLTKIADCGSFDAGTYILFGCVEFPSNATGTRAARFYCGGTGSGTAYAAQAAGSGTRALSISAVQVFSSSTAVELRARQNSGGTLTVSYWWRVLRIK